MSVQLLRAKADLADAIVQAAEQQLAEAAAKVATLDAAKSAWALSLYAGCKVALAERRSEAVAARAKLTA